MKLDAISENTNFSGIALGALTPFGISNFGRFLAFASAGDIVFLSLIWTALPPAADAAYNSTICPHYSCSLLSLD